MSDKFWNHSALGCVAWSLLIAAGLWRSEAWFVAVGFAFLCVSIYRLPMLHRQRFALHYWWRGYGSFAGGLHAFDHVEMMAADIERLPITIRRKPQ